MEKRSFNKERRDFKRDFKDKESKFRKDHPSGFKERESKFDKYKKDDSRKDNYKKKRFDILNWLELKGGCGYAGDLPKN